MKKFITMILALVLSLGTVVSMASCGTNAKLKIIDIALTDEQYAFVVKKGNTSLVNDFNAYLSVIKENGTFSTLVNKYFKDEGTKVGYAVTTNTVTNDDTNFVVDTNCPFSPFEYLGKTDGKIYGLDIEIAAGFAASKNLTLVIKNIDFTTIFSEVDTGYADIGMAGITINAEREGIYDFTNTYYNASQKLIVAANNTVFDACKTVEDVKTILKSLSDKSLGFQIGTTGSMYVSGDEDWGYEGFSNITPKGYSTALLAAMDLINGNIYGVIVDDAPAAAIVKALND